jgi:hypothetical protein
MKCKKIAISVAVGVNAVAATVAMLHCSWMLAVYHVNHYACWIWVLRRKRVKKVISIEMKATRKKRK